MNGMRILPETNEDMKRCAELIDHLELEFLSLLKTTFSGSWNSVLMNLASRLCGLLLVIKFPVSAPFAIHITFFFFLHGHTHYLTKQAKKVRTRPQ